MEKISIVYVDYRGNMGKQVLAICKTVEKAREVISKEALSLPPEAYLGFENRKVEE